jgi:hypothetical protein
MNRPILILCALLLTACAPSDFDIVTLRGIRMAGRRHGAGQFP